MIVIDAASSTAVFLAWKSKLLLALGFEVRSVSGSTVFENWG
jgi:hypothetical protein